MLKKILLAALAIFICTISYASDLKNIEYKNLCNGSKVKILFDAGWTDRVKSKDMEHYVIKGSEIYSYGGELFYDTGCSYIFLRKGSLIGYSDTGFKFYEFTPFDGKINKREILSEEISEIFKNFRVIKISEFSSRTNSYKFKKRKANENIMILNDKNIDMSGYTFTSNNAKFENYTLNNSINITKSGMIQLSQNESSSDIAPWFVILVR